MNVVAESIQRGESSVAELVMAAQPRRGRWLRRLVIFAIFCGLLYAFRYPLMTGAARLWIVDDPIEEADAAVVLGGNLELRPLFAAEIYRNGFVPLVLLADVAKNDKGLPTETDNSVGVLRKMGVPESAIRRFGDGVTCTYDEAVSLRAWLEAHPAKRLVIATDPFHSRRVSYIFARELKGLPVQVSVSVIPPPRYDPLRWWKSEEAAAAFQSEIIKLLYYMLRR